MKISFRNMQNRKIYYKKTCKIRKTAPPKYLQYLQNLEIMEKFCPKNFVKKIFCKNFTKNAKKR